MIRLKGDIIDAFQLQRRCWMDDSARYLNYLENINKKSLLLIFSFNNLFVIRVIFFSIKIWLEGRGREEFLDDEQWMIRHDSSRYFNYGENIHEKWLGVLFLKTQVRVHSIKIIINRRWSDSRKISLVHFSFKEDVGWMIQLGILTI